jgi:hypothetical protein
LPKKFGFDRRRAHFSSLILTKQMIREEALTRICTSELDAHFLEREFEYVAHKLDMSVDELRIIFSDQNKSTNHFSSKRTLIEIGSIIMSFMGLEKRLYK